MKETPRARRSLTQLLKIARSDADALRVDLADIEKARQAAENAIMDLDRQAAAEEEKAASIASEEASFALAAFRDGVRARKHNLQTTLLTLEESAEKARASLEAAFVEVQKLEHLMEINDRADRKKAGQKDRRDMDEIAVIGASRRA